MFRDEHKSIFERLGLSDCEDFEGWTDSSEQPPNEFTNFNPTILQRLRRGQASLNWPQTIDFFVVSSRNGATIGHALKKIFLGQDNEK